MKYALTAAIAAAVCAAPAFAQDGSFYANIGYGQLNADEVDLGAIVLRGGYEFNQNFGAEIEGAFGVNGDELAGADIDLNNSIGAYGVLRAPLGDDFEVFGRAGYVNVEIEASAFTVSAAEDDSAAAIGLGGQYMIDAQNGLRIGYTHFDFDESSDVLDIAYVRAF